MSKKIKLRYSVSRTESMREKTSSHCKSISDGTPPLKIMEMRDLSLQKTSTSIVDASKSNFRPESCILVFKNSLQLLISPVSLQLVGFLSVYLILKIKQVVGIIYTYIQVVGSTGRGKTRTLNLFTGNKVTFSGSRAVK